MNTLTLKDTAEFLFSNDNYLVLIHDKPDGDCFGSAVGLCTLLKKIGKNAQIMSVGKIPERLEFINNGNITVYVGTDGLVKSGYESKTVISVDVASDQLLGKIRDLAAPKNALAIDHHRINTITCGNLYVDSGASATGEIIYELCLELSAKSGQPLLDEVVSHALFSAISSDSGCFKYSNTTPKTHMIAAELMKTGINAENINYRLFDIKSMIQVKVESIAYKNLEFYENGKISFIYITRKELDEIGATDDDTETISQMVRAVAGVQIGAFMREKNPGEFKFSIRSNNECDMSALCSVFGGGGHRKASGCSISGTAAYAKSAFLNEAKNYLE